MEYTVSHIHRIDMQKSDRKEIDILNFARETVSIRHLERRPPGVFDYGKSRNFLKDIDREDHSQAFKKTN